MANYSSPMPAIGLYIAAASLVCFLFQFFDILSGFRSRKPWLPCRLFSLNSLTLSLLAVATKLPVDLTTPMPGALDQLSKLIGTTLICISMAFFIPSIGTMSESECFSNLAALTIFVVTVMVNICIQISTGVIFFFIVEHILILFFMLVFLMFLWVCFFFSAKLKDWFSDELKDRLIKGEESTMMDRLVLCHLDCFIKNPQRISIQVDDATAVGTVSVLCTTVLCEAILRSIVFKKMSFHGGDSDYKWSMWLVVVSQILTVLLGFMGNLIRWIYSDNEGGTGLNLNKFAQSNFLRASVTNIIILILLTPFYRFTSSIRSLFSPFVKMMKRVGIMQQKEVDPIAVAKQICTEERERWKEEMKTQSPTRLIQLFSNTRHSQKPFSNHIQRFYETHKSRLPDQYRVSCLSIVFLTQKAANKLEKEVVRSLVRAFDEVFEIIYFVDKKMSTSTSERVKAKMAKELWTKIWDLNNLHDYSSWKPFLPAEDVNDDFVSQEKLVIPLLIDYFNNNIQQLFVDMLCSFLAKLPQAIIKDVAENQLGDQEKNINRAIQYLMKLEELELVIQWEFPSETNITNLITPRQQASSCGATVHQYTQCSKKQHNRNNGGRNRGGQQQQWQPWTNQRQQWPWPFMQWAVPPCPYPTTIWARPNTLHRKAGVLGPRPQQAYSATAQPTPTDIEVAMHTLGLNPPDAN